MAPSEDSLCRLCSFMARLWGKNKVNEKTAAARLQPTFSESDSLLSTRLARRRTHAHLPYLPQTLQPSQPGHPGPRSLPHRSRRPTCPAVHRHTDRGAPAGTTGVVASRLDTGQLSGARIFQKSAAPECTTRPACAPLAAGQAPLARHLPHRPPPGAYLRSVCLRQLGAHGLAGCLARLLQWHQRVPACAWPRGCTPCTRSRQHCGHRPLVCRHGADAAVHRQKGLWRVCGKPLRRTGGLPGRNGNLLERAIHRLRRGPPLRGGGCRAIV